MSLCKIIKQRGEEDVFSDPLREVWIEAFSKKVSEIVDEK